jgi:hypothetical protein
MMKKIGIFTVLLIAIAACKPEIKPIGDPLKAGEGLPGMWELNEINTIDITLPVPEERDQSGIMKEQIDRLVLTFNADGTYEVNERGIVPDIFGSEGNWMYDQIDFPTMLYFIPSTGDTLKTGLANMPRTTDNNFGFSFTRNRCDKDYITVQYYFNRR